MKVKSLIIAVAVLGLVTTLAVSFVSQRNGMDLSMDRGVVPESWNVNPSGAMDDWSKPESVTSNSIAPQKGMGMMAPGGGVGMMYPPYGFGDALSVDERLYQKSSYISVVVNDVHAYSRQMREYVLNIGGRVLSSSVDTSGQYQSSYLLVKVPVDKFDETNMRATDQVKEVVAENISAQDITGQKVGRDEQIRSLTDQIAEKEIELVEAETQVEKNRIELQLQRLRTQLTQVEQASGQIDEQVQYASVSLSASNNKRQYTPWAEPTLEEEFRRAWESVVGILRMVGKAAIWMVVYAVLWLPVVLVVRMMWNKKKNPVISNSSKTTGSTPRVTKE